ncbi:hypothetical protein CBW54_10415 [Yersinia kristensenii]|nr:hypothetical protein CBW54_10415 [Yersinia kristensenii]
MDKSQGLVKSYVSDVKKIAAKRQSGKSFESLQPEVDDLIKKASGHVAVWVNGVPEENWATFIGQLGFIADTCNDEKYAQILMYAMEIAKKEKLMK